MNREPSLLIGQMMMVGWQTSDVESLLEDVKRYHFGNVLLFSRNFTSVSHLKETCERIQEACKEYNGAPAFISIDQEGGSACRIYEGVTAVPGAMAIAAASSKVHSAASQIGAIIGQELKHIGINFDLAPVADINSNPYNPVIAVRAFSDNPTMVSRLAGEFAQGLQKEGVMACYKHFLGHGDVDVDSRTDLPRIKKSFTDLELCELIPYKAPVADAVMAAHILYTDVDDKFPASISKTILKGLLREKLGYQGLIVTDCFEMGGLDRVFSLGEAAVFAVNAGADMIPVSHQLGRQLAVRGALLTAIKEGVVSMETVLDANRRIADLKAKYARQPRGGVDVMRNVASAQIVSDSSITLLSGRPFEIDSDTVVIGVTGVTAIGTTGTVNPDAEHFTAYHADVAKSIGTAFRVPYRSIDNKNFNVSEMLAFAKGKKVVLCLSDSHLTLIQKVLYSSLMQARTRVMLISMRTPYDILNQDAPECHYCTFEYSELSVSSLIRVLRGAPAIGVSPVKIDRRGGEHSDDTRNYLIDNVITYIKQNYAKKLTLNGVAEEFYISGGHLCKLMKRKLNKNFIDIVNEIRIAEAKRLLTTSTMRVYEIASLCGFSDINYFTKTFGKYTGVTPTYYRNHAQPYI